MESTQLPAMSLLEKLRVMFASVQNWLALQLTLVNVLHCRMRYVTSGYATAPGVVRVSGLHFPADTST